jgi:hypothetical protein
LTTDGTFTLVQLPAVTRPPAPVAVGAIHIAGWLA